MEIDQPIVRSTRSKADPELKPRSTAQSPPKAPVSTRRTQKRKYTDLGEEDSVTAPVNGTSESEVQSIIAAKSASRGRPRRRLDSETTKTKEPEKSDVFDNSERDTISAQSRKTPAATSGSGITPSKTSAQPRGRPRKAPASTAVEEGKAPRKRGRPRKTDKGKVEEILATQDPPGLSDIDAPGETDDETGEVEDVMQVDTGAEADVEDDSSPEVLRASGPAEAEALIDTDPVAESMEEVPSSDIMEHEERHGEDDLQTSFSQGKQKDQIDAQLTPPISVPPSSPKLPAHRARAANPRVKLMDDVDTAPADGGPSGISTKARIARGLSHSQTTGPPTTTITPAKASRRMSTKQKPGPGRSSNGLQLGSSSLLTVVKKGVLDTLRRVGVSSSPTRVQSEIVPESEHEADLTEPPEFPTGEQLLHMAGLDRDAASELPDFEEVEDQLPAAAPVEESTVVGVTDMDVEEVDASAGVTHDMDKYESSTLVEALRSFVNLTLSLE